MGPILIRVKFQNVFETYPFSEVTFIFWSEVIRAPSYLSMGYLGFFGLLRQNDARKGLNGPHHY